MAYNKKQAKAEAPASAVMAALILFAATNPVAAAQTLSPPVVGISVNGRLCCTTDGNCLLGSQGVPGAVVGLNCINRAGFPVEVATNMSDTNGLFDLGVPNLQQTLGNTFSQRQEIPCTVNIPLPLNETLCPILGATEGHLTSVQLVHSDINPIDILEANLRLSVALFARIGN